MHSPAPGDKGGLSISGTATGSQPMMLGIPQEAPKPQINIRAKGSPVLKIRPSKMDNKNSL